MQLHCLFANINICPYLHSIFCPALIPFSFSYSWLTHQTAVVHCPPVPTQHQPKCWEWEWQRSWHTAPLWGRNSWQGLGCIKGNSRTPNCSCQITQIWLSKSPNFLVCLQNTRPGFRSRRANNHDTQRELLFGVVSSNSDTATVTSIKDSSELALVPVQDTEKPECHCPLRLSSLPTSTAQQDPKTTGCFGKRAPVCILGNNCEQSTFLQQWWSVPECTVGAGGREKSFSWLSTSFRLPSLPSPLTPFGTGNTD